MRRAHILARNPEIECRKNSSTGGSKGNDARTSTPRYQTIASIRAARFCFKAVYLLNKRHSAFRWFHKTPIQEIGSLVKPFVPTANCLPTILSATEAAWRHHSRNTTNHQRNLGLHSRSRTSAWFRCRWNLRGFQHNHRRVSWVSRSSVRPGHSIIGFGIRPLEGAAMGLGMEHNHSHPRPHLGNCRASFGRLDTLHSREHCSNRAIRNNPDLPNDP